jgi:hypothetical protein
LDKLRIFSQTVSYADSGKLGIVALAEIGDLPHYVTLLPLLASNSDYKVSGILLV